MTSKELIALLQTFPGDSQVLSEDEFGTLSDIVRVKKEFISGSILTGARTYRNIQDHCILISVTED